MTFLFKPPLQHKIIKLVSHVLFRNPISSILSFAWILVKLPLQVLLSVKRQVERLRECRLFQNLKVWASHHQHSLSIATGAIKDQKKKFVFDKTAGESKLKVVNATSSWVSERRSIASFHPINNIWSGAALQSILPHKLQNLISALQIHPNCNYPNGSKWDD